MSLPPDLESATDSAWAKAMDITGYIGEKEFRALAMLFAGAPPGVLRDPRMMPTSRRSTR